MIIFFCILLAFFVLGMMGSSNQKELALYLGAFAFTVIAIFVDKYASFYWG